MCFLWQITDILNDIDIQFIGCVDVFSFFFNFLLDTFIQRGWFFTEFLFLDERDVNLLIVGYVSTTGMVILFFTCIQVV